ncbi:MAG TPA: DUF302 domain-containing protein [Acidisarcina sp.]|nr:DUF302 domain-containing protein [Acidisarcina sp.]
MNSLLRRTTLAAALFAAFAAAAFAQETRVSVPSNKSYEQTVETFKMAVSKGGMMVMSTVDQGNMLKMTGLSMKGTLFLVGNPNVGKQVFEKDPAAGLYLPLRVYIYQSTAGKTFLSYDKPSVMLKQFDNGTIDQTATMLDQKLDMLTHMVAQ